MFFISLVYIVNFAINDKYTYEVKKIDNTTINEEDILQEEYGFLELNKDEKLNPYVDFSMLIKNFDQFRIYDESTGEYLYGVNEDYMDSDYAYLNITRKAGDLRLEFRYICGNDSNCTSIEHNAFERLFYLFYKGYKLDHQDDIPFEISKDKMRMFHGFYTETEYTRVDIELDWEVIIYKDQKSIFDSLIGDRKETIYGHLKEDHKIIYSELNPKQLPIKHYYTQEGNKEYYVTVFTVKCFNKHYEYILYERKKVEFLDVLANIGALFSTIKFFFALAFSYYSKNFCNYKILGKY